MQQNGLQLPRGSFLNNTDKTIQTTWKIRLYLEVDGMVLYFPSLSVK